METVERRRALTILGVVAALGAGLVAWLVFDARRDNAFETQTSVTRSGGPVAMGQEFLIGAAWLDASEGDHITLTGAALLGRSGDGTVAIYALPDVWDEGSIGAVRRDMLTDDGRTYGDMLQSLAGFAFTAADGTAEVVVGVTPTTDATTRWDAIRVDYMLNGRPGSQTYRNGGTVCVNDQQRPCPEDEG